MRTSSQLRRSDDCEFNPKIKISQHNKVVNLAIVQKQIIKRILMGEPIDDIRSELANSLDARGHVWENINQRDAWLSVATGRIERFIDYEINNPSRANKKFLDEINGGLPLVVYYNDEPIEVKPDYIVEDDENIYVCKIKTGRAVLGRKDLTTPEAYCFGLYGEELNKFYNTDKKVVIQYLYLGDSSDTSERVALFKDAAGNYMIPYDSIDRRYNKITEAYFTEGLKNEINEAISIYNSVPMNYDEYSSL